MAIAMLPKKEGTAILWTGRPPGPCMVLFQDKLLRGTDLAALLVAMLHSVLEIHRLHTEGTDFMAIAMLLKEDGTAISRTCRPPGPCMVLF